MIEIRVGCRRSQLAQAQTDLAIQSFQKYFPRLQFTKKLIETAGDRDQSALPTGVGVFVKALEDELLNSKIDIALHSAKDLPTALPAGLQIVAVGQRADWRDCVISRTGEPLSELRSAKVGTSAPRRIAQLRSAYNRLEIVPMRGNVDTRLQKLHHGEYDAVVLATAGLQRLGLSGQITEYLDCLPAGGQGVLAAEYRVDNKFVQTIVESTTLNTVQEALLAEREFLRTIQAGCQTPVGVLAMAENDSVTLKAELFTLDGSNVYRAERTGRAGLAVARELAEDFLTHAKEII